MTRRRKRIPADLLTQYGKSCPKCGWARSLIIDTRCLAVLTIDGITSQGDYEWDPDSHCICKRCGHTGVVMEFCLEVGGEGGADDVTSPRHVPDAATTGSRSPRDTVRRIALARRELTTLIASCREALDGRWSRCDEGFAAILESAERARAALKGVRS